MDGWIFDRQQIFHAAIEVARHPIGRRDVDLGQWRWQRLAISEHHDPAVFQKTSDDRSHPNPRRHASHARYQRSEEHTSELQSLMRISYAVFCLKKKNKN